MFLTIFWLWRFIPIITGKRSCRVKNRVRNRNGSKKIESETIELGSEEKLKESDRRVDRAGGH